MVARSNRKLKALSVGDNVIILVSVFDTGKGDPLNLLGVVLDTNVSGNFKVGTKAGVIQGWLARTAVEFVKHCTLSPSAVPSNELMVRSAVRSLSIGNGQGYVRCQCRGMCLIKRCFCFKAGNLCNSACHPKLTCKNKTDFLNSTKL
jgi:hypothetical protein